MRKTKIICTLGPKSDDIEILRKLFLNGMNAIRLNFSHGTHEEHKQRIDRANQLMKELNVHIPILLDTKGPEIRIGVLKEGVAELKKGQEFTFVTEEILGDENKVSISSKNLYQDVKPGDTILLDDGLIELRVKEIKNTDIVCEVLNNGTVYNRKGINIPNVDVNLPTLTSKDKEDLLFAIEHDLDYIAQSFVRSAEDVQVVRSFLDENGGNEIKIIAKIENRQGINNIDEIIKIADGIMVARGDLGVEVPIEELPVIQRMLIANCYKNGKLVITATQMLDSMIRNPRPTRAEVNDVANAVYEGTSAIMLSGETAAGKYPVEALKTMARICVATEQSIDYWEDFRMWRSDKPLSITDAISHATCTTAMTLKAKEIITVTKSGTTARMISRFRPNCPIIAATTSEKVLKQLSLYWGISPILIDEVESTDDLFSICVRKSLEADLVNKGDLVVITAGIPVGISGNTNLLRVKIVDGNE